MILSNLAFTDQSEYARFRRIVTQVTTAPKVPVPALIAAWDESASFRDYLEHTDPAMARALRFVAEHGFVPRTGSGWTYDTDRKSRVRLVRR